MHPGTPTFVSYILKVPEDLVIRWIEGAHLQQRQGRLNWDRIPSAEPGLTIAHGRAQLGV